MSSKEEKIIENSNQLYRFSHKRATSHAMSRSRGQCHKISVSLSVCMCCRLRFYRSKT